MFIGRKKELEKLNNIINEVGQNNILIYGRRRVGKSELLKQCLSKNKIKYIYYECKQTTESNNAISICNELKQTFNIPIKTEKIEEVLDYIFTLSVKENIILVLDEYVYLKEFVIGIDSILQNLIDKYHNNTNLKLILCGSYINIMKSLINYASPLYGRFDYVIELKPMNYYESQFFYDDYSYEDKVKIYSVFGGIPYYNKLIDTKKTVKENIIDLISSNDARLENEINLFLLGQLKKINNANIIFETLAKGFTKFKDILDQSKISTGPTLIDGLDKLIDMDLVEKIYPINDANNKKRTNYYICDNLSLFYYKYIYPNKSKINILNSDMFYEKFIKEDFENYYVPKMFEKIAREYLIKENKLGNINPPFYEIGKYYYDDIKNKKNGEFDIVTLDDLGYIFYEVKYRKDKITYEMVLNEIKQVKETNLNCYKYGFIAKSGFVFDDNDLILLTLEDIYK